jgi:hypothetical protein
VTGAQFRELFFYFLFHIRTMSIAASPVFVALRARIEALQAMREDPGTTAAVLKRTVATALQCTVSAECQYQTACADFKASSAAMAEVMAGKVLIDDNYGLDDLAPAPFCWVQDVFPVLQTVLLSAMPVDMGPQVAVEQLCFLISAFRRIRPRRLRRF